MLDKEVEENALEINMYLRRYQLRNIQIIDGFPSVVLHKHGYHICLLQFFVQIQNIIFRP